MVLSGDQFISSPDRRLELVETFPEAQVAEMEGAAISQIAYDFKVPFIVIRAVSDSATEQSPITYDEFMPMAAAKSAKLVKAMVDRM